MVRYVFLSLNVLNGLLALAVAAVVHFAVIPLLNPVARISLPAVEETAAPSGEQKALSRPFPVTDYTVISDKNLFHPERKIPLEKRPEKAVPKPDVVLYGTLIADDASYAFIEDKQAPYSTPGRGKRQITLKKGDRLSGYTLREITEDRIVLVKGEEKVVVMLDDSGKKRTDAAPAVPATARTSAAGTTPSPAIPGSPPPAIAASPSPAGRSSAPAAASPGPGSASLAPRPSPQPAASSAPQTMPPSAQDGPSRPGIGASGTWPPTRDSVEQTRQKLKDAQQMRMNQLKRGQ
ncbi:MAG: hypothetical protein IH628_13695 [Proteobacteria bacterium]|nr:hypothetical protein [Pseudomonadota bacterium]